MIGTLSDPGFRRDYSLSLIKDGKLQWTSPELLFAICGESEHYHPTEESDCYSLGMVTYELLSGKTPFAHDSLEVMVKKVLAGERPSRPRWWGGKLITDDIWNTLEHCWGHYPCDRMNASEVLLCLEGHPVPIQAILERGEKWRYRQERRREERRASIRTAKNYFDLVDD